MVHQPNLHAVSSRRQHEFQRVPIRPVGVLGADQSFLNFRNGSLPGGLTETTTRLPEGMARPRSVLLLRYLWLAQTIEPVAGWRKDCHLQIFANIDRHVGRAGPTRRPRRCVLFQGESRRGIGPGNHRGVGGSPNDAEQWGAGGLDRHGPESRGQGVIGAADLAGKRLPNGGFQRVNPAGRGAAAAGDGPPMLFFIAFCRLCFSSVRVFRPEYCGR